MANLPKIALGAWAWGNDGTFGNDITADSLKPIFDNAMANGLFGIQHTPTGWGFPRRCFTI